MNWYLILIGFIGIAIIFCYQWYKLGLQQIITTNALLRYGVGIILLFVGVHFHTSKEVQGAITLFAFGALMVFINWGADKVK